MFKKKMIIGGNDVVQGYSGSPIRIFPMNSGAYVLSQPSPEELANFLRDLS